MDLCQTAFIIYQLKLVNECHPPITFRDFSSSMYNENEPERQEGAEEVEQQHERQQQQQQQQQQDEEEVDPFELQPGEHVVETEELEEEEAEMHFKYDLDNSARHGNQRPCDFLEEIARDEGYSSWQVDRYVDVHVIETRGDDRTPARGFPWEDLPSNIYPSQRLMAKRREFRAKQRRFWKLEWVYEEMNFRRLGKKAEQRMGRAAISLMVAEIFVNVLERSEGIIG